MKTLCFIRHAKAIQEDYVQSDIERHLAPRGYADSVSAARWLKENKLYPDLIVCSPAIRAYSTAIIISQRMGIPPDHLVLSGAIYEANVPQLLKVVNSIPDKYDTVFLFGHNPGFTDIVNYLCGPVLSHLSTSGIAVIKSSVSSFAAISEGTCSIEKAFEGR